MIQISSTAYVRENHLGWTDSVEWTRISYHHILYERKGVFWMKWFTKKIDFPELDMRARKPFKLNKQIHKHDSPVEVPIQYIRFLSHLCVLLYLV